MTNVQQAAFIDEYLAHENIVLNPSNVTYNNAMRQTMKLILNSLWGKFGQRGNMTQSKICVDTEDFNRLMFSDRYHIKDWFKCPQNEQVYEVQYVEPDMLCDEPSSTNVYVACFTTCLARLQLYGVLSALGTRVLYYDTDSVVYRHDDRMSAAQQDAVHLGSHLGDLTDELCQDGSRWITEFVATGPKSYSYRDNHNRVSCKFKGLAKSLWNINVVNLESMLLCVQKGRTHLIHGAKNLIFKLDHFGRIKTDYQAKVFRLVYDKRWIGANYITYPYGY